MPATCIPPKSPLCVSKEMAKPVFAVAGRLLIDFMYTVSEHAIGIIPKEIGWRNRGRVPGCLLETRQKKDEHSNVECGTHDVMSHMMRLCVVLRVIMADRWWHAWKGL